MTRDRARRAPAGIVALLAVIATLGGCAAQQGLSMRAEDAKITSGAEIPVDVPFAVYVPEVHLDMRFYSAPAGAWITPGDALRAAITTATEAYFTRSGFIEVDKPSYDQYGLVATLAPEWDIERGKIILTLGYRVYDAAGEMVTSGEATRSKPIGSLQDSAGFYNAALKTMQIVIVETINKAFRNDATYEGRIAANDVDKDLLVNMDDTVRTGTAFFVSESGKLLTAAHVINGCLRAQIQFEDNSHDVEVVGSSSLLDVALLQSEVITDKFLALRAEPKIVLGERVSTAGFPLKNVLAASANLTVGNVSSLKALPGSLGKFQFSAPIQPGSSGSPLISEQGELIGMTTGTLNVAAMAESGTIPQNVNFALAGEYLEKFNDRYAPDLRRFDENLSKGDMAGVNEHLAASVAQVACYQ